MHATNLTRRRRSHPHERRSAIQNGEPAMNHDKILREHLVNLINGGNAHAGFEAAIKDLPSELRGKTPKGAEHSPWQILDHLRIAQWDILEFSRNAKHESPKWPEGYWPATAAPADDKAWDKSVREFRRDMKALCELI